MVVLRWFGKNLTTVFLAFGLALVVWVSSVTAADPNEEFVFPRSVPLEVVNQDPGLKIMNTLPETVRVTLNAPRSIRQELTALDQPLRAWVDLDGLQAGMHTLPVQVRITVPLTPVRIVTRSPIETQVTLEALVTVAYPVNLFVEGEPAIGYQAGDVVYSPDVVLVSGAVSVVSRVAGLRAYLDINGARQSVDTSISLEPVDEAGELVRNVELLPPAIDVSQPVNLLGGYRNVIVKVVYEGQLTDGYKLTNILVSPPILVIFSSDLELLNQMPGYIETMPLDLTGVSDDVEAFLELDLPEGIEVPNDQKVLVQISVSAIESNLALSLPVDVIGLTRGLVAQVAPSTVDVIISGPLPVLRNLKPSDLRVFVDLTGRDIGSYQLSPSVTFLPDRVQVESILPSTLEVTILQAPTPTPSSTPSPTLDLTPTPTPTPSR